MSGIQKVGLGVLGYLVFSSVVMLDFGDEMMAFLKSLPLKNTFTLLWFASWFGSLILSGPLLMDPTKTKGQ